MASGGLATYDLFVPSTSSLGLLGENAGMSTAAKLSTASAVAGLLIDTVNYLRGNERAKAKIHLPKRRRR